MTNKTLCLVIDSSACTDSGTHIYTKQKVYEKRATFVSYQKRVVSCEQSTESHCIVSYEKRIVSCEKRTVSYEKRIVSYK